MKKLKVLTIALAMAGETPSEYREKRKQIQIREGWKL
jgi:hypothetical protein